MAEGYDPPDETAIEDALLQEHGLKPGFSTDAAGPELDPDSDFIDAALQEGPARTSYVPNLTAPSIGSPESVPPKLEKTVPQPKPAPAPPSFLREAGVRVERPRAVLRPPAPPAPEEYRSDPTVRPAFVVDSTGTVQHVGTVAKFGRWVRQKLRRKR